MFLAHGGAHARFPGERKLLLIWFFMLLFLVPVATVHAGQWGGAVIRIQASLDQVLALYEKGDIDAAKAAVNQAYFGVYEETGMEAAVRLHISAKQAATEEHYFSRLKSLMGKGAPVADVREARETLVKMLRSDAATLEGGGGGTFSDLLSSFLIIAREGLEAILLIAALSAYLIKTGQPDQVRTIYQGATVAIALSLVTAWLLSAVLKVGGTAQEALEGATMLVAAAVLLSVSFWMISKAQAAAWQSYLKEQVGASLSRGSRLSLWWAAFLAVYREGAETVLFYQALLSGGASPGWLAAGFALGIALLVVVFLAVRWGSWKIPLRPFFGVTSILLFYMAVVFAGKGIIELQESGLVPATPMAGAPTIDWAGVYPTAQSLGIQALLLFLALIAGLVSLRRRKVHRT